MLLVSRSEELSTKAPMHAWFLTQLLLVFGFAKQLQVLTGQQIIHSWHCRKGSICFGEPNFNPFESIWRFLLWILDSRCRTRR